MKGKINKYEIPKHVIDNWDIIGVEFIRLTFEQSEKYLSETVKSAEGITVKSLKVLTIGISLLTISLGYYLTSENNNIIISDSALLSSGISFLSILMLIKPIWGYNIHVPGSQPKFILGNDKMITQFKTGEAQYRNLLLSESIEYQNRISFNQSLNVTRSKYVNIAMILLSLIPFTIVLSWIWRIC